MIYNQTNKLITRLVAVSMFDSDPFEDTAPPYPIFTSFPVSLSLLMIRRSTKEMWTFQCMNSTRGANGMPSPIAFTSNPFQSTRIFELLDDRYQIRWEESNWSIEHMESPSHIHCTHSIIDLVISNVFCSPKLFVLRTFQKLKRIQS